MGRFPYKKTLLLGFGFFGISVIWPIFNNFVPIFLVEMGLTATMVSFVMTWDNYLNMFIQPIVGERSDHTHIRVGRRKPWMLIGAPIAASFFPLVPALRSVVGDDARLGAFTGLYYFASNIAAVAGPQIVGLLVDITDGNYRIMFVFSALFMALAALFMTRVREAVD